MFLLIFTLGPHIALLIYLNFKFNTKHLNFGIQTLYSLSYCWAHEHNSSSK